MEVHLHLLGKSLGEKKPWGKIALALAGRENILEISSMKQNTLELPAQEEWTD